jgi:hypothetical protein
MGRTWSTIFCFVLFCFQMLASAPVHPLEPALPEDVDKLWPFATNLDRLAACTGHCLGADYLAVLHLPFADPLAPAPFSGVRTHSSRQAPPIPTGPALAKTIHPRIVPSLSPTSESLPCSYLHSRGIL